MDPRDASASKKSATLAPAGKSSPAPHQIKLEIDKKNKNGPSCVENIFGRKQTAHFRGNPPPPSYGRMPSFQETVINTFLIFLNQECSYLGWTHEEPSLGVV